MNGAVPGLGRRFIGALGSIRGPASPRLWTPVLPPGRRIVLPGRGEAFVRDHRPAGVAGPPVLLLHGWTWSLDVNYFAVMPELVAAGIPFVGFDQRGHGRGLPAGRPFEVADLAADAVAVLDHFGIARVLVCGYSLGGPVGLHLALAHPERVAGMVIAGAALSYRQSLRDRTVWRVLSGAAPLARLGVGSSMPARYFGASRRASAELAQRWPWVREELARTTVSGALTMARAVSRYDLRDRVASLRDIPVTAIVTTCDTVCAPRWQRQLAGQVGARTVELPDDHDVPVARPDAFAAAVLGGVGGIRDRLPG